MIASTLLRLVEDLVKQKFKANVVPFDKAYPTSGQDFIRLSANSMSLTLEGDQLTCELQIVATCSTRIRTQAVQNQDIGYVRVMDLAEKVYFWLFLKLNNSFRGQIEASIPGVRGVDGRLEVNYLDLRAMPVYADFYDSKEVHERQPAGLKVDITALLPRIWLPVQCDELPQFIMDELEISE